MRQTTMPYLTSAFIVPAGTAAPEPAGPPGPPTVLVADDDEDVRALVEFTLESAGYRVIMTGDGLSALSLAVQHRPQLILLDVVMPGLNGLDICYELRAKPRTTDIPVLILSGRDTSGDIDLGMTLGASYYMTKPFRPQELLNRVQRLLHP
ncbi:response regulator transcription factor [Catenuloplanes atrovinosus]|uniref:DNA-binding response OmpR family regulator n=1 Tax=Catenuloplanes atrovinosus TaxID=137266 RepID=A0AAE3YK61_9ACTN|nr:response regulator [Catenuloplanes atrovinosus]MDR7275269.1 DNA-binding response OmpR family regulator [Catenuloplanes atrovinosus]